MEAVLRAVVIYAFLMLLFRIAGKRALNEVSNFEFVLLLIVGEATQQAALGKDYSLTNAFLVVLTLISINIGMSLLKHRSKSLWRMFDGMPLVIVEIGRASCRERGEV